MGALALEKPPPDITRSYFANDYNGAAPLIYQERLKPCSIPTTAAPAYF